MVDIRAIDFELKGRKKLVKKERIIIRNVDDSLYTLKTLILRLLPRVTLATDLLDDSIFPRQSARRVEHEFMIESRKSWRAGAFTLLPDL